MPSIAFFTAHARFPWGRQLPPGIADGWRVTIGEIAPDCAVLVVYDDIKVPVSTTLPRARRMVVLSEPPGITTYREGYLAQFGTVLGPVEPKGHEGWRACQPGLPWFYGLGFAGGEMRVALDRAALAALPMPEKRPGLSVVISKKSQLPKHRARLAFVEALKAQLGDRLAIFGRGFNAIDDKAEAIAPYTHHLVLENNDIPHFWTEKTADAFLGWSFPLISGCANLGEYFPEAAFTRIDIANFERAAAMIEAALDAGVNAAQVAAIGEARRRLLEEHDLAHLLRREAHRLGADIPAPTRAETLHGNRDFKPLRRLGRALGLR